MFGQSLLSAFGSAACTTDTDQLFATDVQTTSLATYQLNNATTSIPSNTYPGTASNITYAAGKFGNAAVFNGSSSKIVASSKILDNKTELTISLWIKNLGGANYSGIIGEGGDSGQAGYVLAAYPDNTTLEFWRSNGDNLSYVFVGGSYNFGLGNYWTHVAITVTPSEVKYYKNGVNVKTTSITNTSTVSSANNTTLMYNAQYNRYNSGLLDQVRMFDTVLPQSAITALYNETTTTATYPYVDYVNTNPNSIAYYKMSNATDQLGNYNGTATNVNFNTEGKFGFAGAFNGSSSYILLNGMTTAGFAPTAYSISAWFKTTSNNEAIFSTDAGGNPISTRTRIFVNSSGYVEYEPFTISQKITSTVTVNDGNWHFVCVSTDSSGNTKLYVDNQSPITGTGGGINFRVQTWIGCTDNAVYSTIVRSNFFNGSIDQIRVYDSAISAENVTTLYKEIECPAVAVTNAFNTVLYTGDSGTSRQVTGVGFEPSWIWIKRRNSSESHAIYDSVRGINKQLSSNETSQEATNAAPYEGVKSFDAYGFTTGNNGGTNRSPNTYVAWNWKAGGADVLNEEGTIDSQVSANVDAGFSIVKSSPNLGNGQSGTLGHGLDSAPEMIITKSLDQTLNWWTSIDGITGVQDDYVALNLTNAKNNLGSSYPFGRATSSVFSISNAFISTSSSLISYCFHSVDGYSKVGSYSGTGVNGNSIYTGFEPAYVMVKRTNAADNWTIVDSKRGLNESLFADDPSQELNNSGAISFESNGFTVNGASGGWNNGSSTYIFMAIA